MTAIITVAPVGPIASRTDNPSLPVTPEALAEQVAEARALGAAVAHLHIRDLDERPTADLDRGREVMEAVAARCDILIQLSTGVGLGVPFEQRAGLVELRPAMATLNTCSMSFGESEFSNPPKDVARLAARMQELGVKPELEIYDTGHLEACLRLRDAGLLEDPLQFSIVLGVRGGMAATPQNLLMMVDRLPAGCVWQVIAIGSANLWLTAMGLALGGNARAGLEDSLHVRRGELADGNRPLVSRAVQLARDLDRQIATPGQAREQLNLPATADV